MDEKFSNLADKTIEENDEALENSNINFEFDDSTGFFKKEFDALVEKDPKLREELEGVYEEILSKLEILPWEKSSWLKKSFSKLIEDKGMLAVIVFPFILEGCATAPGLYPEISTGYDAGKILSGYACDKIGGQSKCKRYSSYVIESFKKKALLERQAYSDGYTRPDRICTERYRTDYEQNACEVGKNNYFKDHGGNAVQYESVDLMRKSPCHQIPNSQEAEQCLNKYKRYLLRNNGRDKNDFYFVGPTTTIRRRGGYGM